MRHSGVRLAGRQLLVLMLTFCLVLLTPAGFAQQNVSSPAGFRVDKARVLTGAILAASLQGGSAVPSSFVGCLLRDDGAYVLYDETTRATVELHGNDEAFQSEWGNRVQVIGVPDDTVESDVASQVVSVTSFSRVDTRDCSEIATAIGAQMPLGQLASQSAGVLNIVILEGDGAINNIRQRTAREPIVQVQDENNRPVAGATVVFLLPEGGPGGTFPGGMRSLSVLTDSNGQAIAQGLQPNALSGQYQIQVQASYQGQSAQTAITQTNAGAAAAAGGVSGKLIAILVAVGGAAAAGGVLALRGGDDSVSPQPGPGPTPVTPTTITPGTTTVGGPP